MCVVCCVLCAFFFFNLLVLVGRSIFFDWHRFLLFFFIVILFCLCVCTQFVWTNSSFGHAPVDWSRRFNIGLRRASVSWQHAHDNIHCVCSLSSCCHVPLPLVSGSNYFWRRAVAGSLHDRVLYPILRFSYNRCDADWSNFRGNADDVRFLCPREILDRHWKHFAFVSKCWQQQRW